MGDSNDQALGGKWYSLLKLYQWRQLKMCVFVLRKNIE